MPYRGVNLGGLLPNLIWQMYVAHVAEFGKLRYVKIAVNINSGFLMTVTQPREATRHVIIPCLKCFSYVKIPIILKMNSVSEYINKGFQQLCSQWNTEHKTVIFYKARNFRMCPWLLKYTISKDKKGELYPQ